MRKKFRTEKKDLEKERLKKEEVHNFGLEIPKRLATEDLVLN